MEGIKKYNVRDNGDPLEKFYADFIQTQFKSYEKVWSIYIGNTGYSTIAPLIGFSQDEEYKRQSFSENTYTILQSVIALYRLVNSKNFNDPITLELESILNLHNDIMLFFAHLGRIRDCSLAANKMLLDESSFDIETCLKSFYEQRHVIVHGKMIPLQFNSNGTVQIPKLNINSEPLIGWSNKGNNWRDVLHIRSEYVGTSISETFWQLVAKLNEIFGQFYTAIQRTLSSRNLTITYTYAEISNMSPSGVSCYAPNKVSIYGIEFK